jgi:hypothetical protein
VGPLGMCAALGGSLKKLFALFVLLSTLWALGACNGGGSPPPPAGATHFSVTVSSPTATAGTAINITVSALDASGAVFSSYSGTVRFSSSDGQAVLPPNSALTSGTGTFSVTLKTSGNQTVMAADAGAPSISGTSSSISVSPGVAAQLSVSSSSATPTAGMSFNVTLSALDALNNTVTSYSGTVHFTSSDPRAVLPNDSPLSNGTGTFPVTFKTAGGQTIMAADTAGHLTAGTSSSITVSSAAPTTFSVIAPSAVTTGLGFAITVNALDAFANVATSYSGTVHLSSSTDSQAVFPNDSKLLNGTGNFFPVTLKTIGPQTITATDTVTPTDKGASGSINVVTNAATHFAFVSFPTAINTRTPFNFGVNALDGANNVATGYAGTAKFSSTDTQAVLPPNPTLTAGVSSVSATMESAGTWTVTATDTAMVSITGTSSINVTKVPDLAITSSAPPNGMVGTNYGHTITQTQRCFWVIFGPGGPHQVCTPCNPPGSCALLPPCTGARFEPPCRRTRLIFAPFTFTATGGVPPYKWSATGMPPGLSVNPVSGQVLGTPTAPNPNPYNITVSVTDSGLPPLASPVTANYPVTIAPPPAPAVHTTPVPPPGVVNLPYTFTFSASGYPPLTWNESGALPNGLAFNNTSGVLSGTPTVANSFPISVTATDQFNQISTAANFTIVIYLHGFAITGGMGAARTSATATLLNSGKVLVAGGTDASGNSLATAELYDPATGNFSSTGSMGTGRAHFAATLLNTGKVLVTGGLDSAGNPLATAELYDPTTGTFSPTSGGMTTVRASHTATLLNTGQNTDKVLVAGWGNATAELFDPVTGTFAGTGSMVTARVSHTATLLSGGKVLLTGGVQGTGATLKVLAEAELYDPVTGRFSQTAGSLATAREWHTATLLTDGKVLVTGGLDSTGIAIASAELFDLTSQSFTPKGNMATPRAFHTATLLNDGTVLVTGGIDGAGPIATAEFYDPAAGTFSPTGGLGTARQSHTATLLKDGRVLVTGGAGANSAPLATAEIYK